MLKNKKSSIISLEVLIGIVIAIIIFASAATIISRFYRLSDASKDSFNQLVALIGEVNQDNHGTRKSMPLRMDEDTAIIGFLKNKESVVSIGEIETKYVKYSNLESIFNKPSNCKKDKACICLCRKPIRKKDSRNFICEDKNLICKTLDGLDFIGDGFIISRSQMPDIFTIRSSLISTEDMSQFRDISVEKYSEYGEELIAVCENLEEGSCVSKEYREEKKAIYGLKKLKEFIESCKDRKFVDIENPEPCSCGAFDFTSEFPEKYIVEFIESDEKNLKLILRHEDKKDEIISSIKVDMPLCTYQPILKGTDLLPKDKSIILKYNLPPYYTFYYKEDVEDERIVFVKDSDENICILRASERGYIGLDAESQDIVTFKPVSNIQRGIERGHPEINIIGCKYPEEAEWYAH